MVCVRPWPCCLIKKWNPLRKDVGNATLVVITFPEYDSLIDPIKFIIHSSARFSQKVVSGKKPPTSKNLVAHLEILPLTPQKLVAKIATKT